MGAQLIGLRYDGDYKISSAAIWNMFLTHLFVFVNSL